VNRTVAAYETANRGRAPRRWRRAYTFRLAGVRCALGRARALIRQNDGVGEMRTDVMNTPTRWLNADDFGGLSRIEADHAMTLDVAKQVAQEMVEEWDWHTDPHGFCHVRPVFMALLAAIGDDPVGE
jgi:hypothetical protein